MVLSVSVICSPKFIFVPFLFILESGLYFSQLPRGSQQAKEDNRKAYIHLYQGNPIAGGTNGTQVSEDNSGSQAVIFTFNATNNEEEIL